jgi:hypothetical protein
LAACFLSNAQKTCSPAARTVSRIVHSDSLSEPVERWIPTARLYWGSPGGHRVCRPRRGCADPPRRVARGARQGSGCAAYTRASAGRGHCPSRSGSGGRATSQAGGQFRVGVVPRVLIEGYAEHRREIIAVGSVRGRQVRPPIEGFCRPHLYFNLLYN